MPTVHLDTEQADLVEASVQMMEAALTARVKRADPEQFISNSLALQASKLQTFRSQLRAPEPPAFDMLALPLREKALTACATMTMSRDRKELNAAWALLRGLTHAADLPGTAQAR